MSVLRMLAILALATPGSEVFAPNLFAQTSTPYSLSAKAKAPAVQKKAPARKPAVNPDGTPGFTVPEEDTWYQVGATPAAQVQSPYARASSTQHQAGLIGVVNYFGSGIGAEYLYAFRPRLSFGASFMHTQATLEDDGSKEATEFLDATSNSLRLYARYAVFTYLYGGAGINLDSLSGSYGWKGAAVIGDTIQTDYTARIYAFDVFFGSEWRGPWSTYIGVDWLGFAVPLAGTIEYNAAPDVESTSKALKGKTPNQRLDEETSAQLRFYYLNLRVGMVF